MGLLGILVGLSLVISLRFVAGAFLLLAPIAALVAAAFGAQPLLANWTQIFMVSAASFLAQFFPIFLLGAVFGKLMDAGANASVLPALSVASLVGFGAVIAALPAFVAVRDWVLAIEGGPLVFLAVATNVLAALTGSASGGLTIALDALGQTYAEIAAQTGIDPALMHRVAVIGSGTLDILPHNGAVVSLLSICGMTHHDSYFDIFMVGIVPSVVVLAVVIMLGGGVGSF
ncbi:hypothetical protein [Bradyrhizobium sp. CCGUVB23]|uniref:hypothetical protein n=1 Tax=Bradyrhizobium sp. CCGUVB23 TaxID=2949630 RepID=UPI0020B20277|nr:hypothetical protein [Bradyrhizobium sp. CCGUVB23]MCP3468384.1 hypothetical protein [Bradyrhizobium sp. CCGUVB23]